MAPHHRRRIGASRRTVDDEGEEDGFPGTVDDDSLSEGTVSSQSHDEDDGCSEITETEGGERSLLEGGRLPLRSKKSSSTSTATPRGQGGGGGTGGGRREEGSGDGEGGERNSQFNARTSETDNMANGSKEAAPEPVQEIGDLMTFDDDEEEEKAATTTASRPNSGGQKETLAERKRREQDEYFQKRNDPSFVPTRGGFFLHDNRSGNGNSSGRPKQIKSKPHGLIVDSNVSRKPQPDIRHAPWRHDLHDTINQPSRPPQSTTAATTSTTTTNNNNVNTSYQPKPVPTAPRTSPQNRSFSTTVLIGNVPVIVFLPGMETPIPFSAVPKRQHTRLPQHRPPLRRDKPVRISLPGQAPRYIFPSTERSFIFIPRALRPNQQASYRGRDRGGGSGGGGFYSSRRASVYSGSAYSHAPTHTPSVSLSMSMSRRSSMGRDMSVNGATPPLGSTMTMARPVVPQDSRPVVRLPPQVTPVQQPAQLQQQQQQQQQHQQQQQQPPPPTSVPPSTAGPYFAPQNPTYRENRPHPAIPMHQPRPQKTVSVADIESPAASAAAYQYSQQQQQQQPGEQPFHHQVPQQPPQPMSMSGYAPTPEMNMPMAMAVPMAVPMPMPMPMYQHQRHLSHPPPTSATPLSQIPERAIHAAPFQPVTYQQQPAAYYGQPYHHHHQHHPHQPPPQHPPHHNQYAVAAAAVPPATGTEYPYTPGGAAPGGTGPGTVAHESNGTVYYYDASQVSGPGGSNSSTTSTGAAAGAAVPPAGGVLGMGGMMTPPGATTYYYPHPPHVQNGPVYYQ
ncbi:Btz domain-containing protein [Trichophyton interdigitale]|uniref:Btz domain-containing protein n=1 Tax=Trichophyton interdigitale TaxID=101480 RepID=A0A9P4YHL1_9EURO|nr:Btz domain-containing protein [Trichophyton interdigitale]KAF3895233.1 Btz domain-containing protein [Trichophyton interdigitale]KAG8208710.1 Btz domain-containing protein [Trichophyton interdigitale]